MPLWELLNPAQYVKGPGNSLCPSVHLVMGRQTSIKPEKPVGAGEPAPIYIGHCREKPGEYCLGQKPKARESL